MLMFDGDVEIISENEEWVVYGVKAMGYFYSIQIPVNIKQKAESTKQKFLDSLKQHGIDFKDLVIDIRKEKGRNYNAEIERKAYERKPRKEKAEPTQESQRELF